METNSLWQTTYGKIATRSAQTLIILALVSTLIFGLTQLTLVVVPLILATILASAIYPLVSLMEKIRIKRAAGSLLTILTFLSLLGGAGYFIFRSVQTQWSSLASSVVEGFDQIVVWLHSGDLPVPVENIDGIIDSTKGYFTSSSFGQGALQFSGNIASTLTGAILTLMILFFFLKDGKRIFSFLVSFMKPNIRVKAHESGVSSAVILGGYIRGTTTVALVDVVLIAIGLSIMDVPLVLPLCLLVFIGAFIPYIGGISAGVIACLVALVANGVDNAIIVAIIVVAVNQLEGHILAPFILGNALKISPLAILLTLAVGAILGGIVGTLLAVPVVAVVWATWTTWNRKAKPIEDPPAPEDTLSSEEEEDSLPATSEE